MPKISTIVEFDEKEIRSLLTEKAKEQAGKGVGSSETRLVKTDEGFSAQVTFNGK